MLKHKRVSISGGLFLILLILPALGLAQDMAEGKWWRNPRAAKYLSLSDEEKATLDEKYVESRRRLIALKSNVEQEQFELDNLLESEVLNEDALRQQFRKLEKARSDLASERFNFLLDIRNIVGFERFQQIKALYQLRHHRKDRKGESIDPRRQTQG